VSADTGRGACEGRRHGATFAPPMAAAYRVGMERRQAELDQPLGIPAPKLRTGQRGSSIIYDSANGGNLRCGTIAAGRVSDGA
jgi:hypothetical protein